MKEDKSEVESSHEGGAGPFPSPQTTGGKMKAMVGIIAKDQRQSEAGRPPGQHQDATAAAAHVSGPISAISFPSERPSALLKDT